MDWGIICTFCFSSNTEAKAEADGGYIYEKVFAL